MPRCPLRDAPPHEVHFLFARCSCRLHNYQEMYAQMAERAHLWQVNRARQAGCMRAAGRARGAVAESCALARPMWHRLRNIWRVWNRVFVASCLMLLVH